MPALEVPKQKMGKVCCIRHPRSDWYNIPADKNNPNHVRALGLGLSELICLQCVLPETEKYDTGE